MLDLYFGNVRLGERFIFVAGLTRQFYFLSLVRELNAQGETYCGQSSAVTGCDLS